MPASPARLCAALSRTPVADLDVAVIVTFGDGAIGYWNAEAERIYGWKAEEVIGQNIVDVTPSVSKRVDAEAVMETLQRGEPWEGEMLLRRRDGEVFDAFVIDTPLPGDGASSFAIIGVSGPADEAERVRRGNGLVWNELSRLHGAIGESSNSGGPTA